MGDRPRDVALERELCATAAKAAGYTSSGGLCDFADHRALPGPVAQGRDFAHEALEELADARNYLLWGIERIYAKVLAGDADAQDEYARLMRALGGVIAAWHALTWTRRDCLPLAPPPAADRPPRRPMRSRWTSAPSASGSA